MTGQFHAMRPVSRHGPPAEPSTAIWVAQQHHGMGHMWTQLEPHFQLRRTFDPGFIHGPT